MSNLTHSTFAARIKADTGVFVLVFFPERHYELEMSVAIFCVEDIGQHGEVLDGSISSAAVAHTAVVPKIHEKLPDPCGSKFLLPDRQCGQRNRAESVPVGAALYVLENTFFIWVGRFLLGKSESERVLSDDFRHVAAIVGLVEKVAPAVQ